MKKTGKETIHIAFGLYDPKGTYSKYVGTAITSIFENTESPIVVHILTDRYLSEKNRNRFLELAADYQQTILFYEIDLGDSLPKLRGLKRVTQGTLYRLKLPDVISNTIDKIIYLDADIVVNMDIRNLWEEDIADYAILAVKDLDSEKSASGELEKRGLLNGATYYNAGVMVWNLKKIREHYDIFAQAMEFFEKYGEFCKGFTDQHASNHIFMGNVRLLPSVYNTFTCSIRPDGGEVTERIYHFASERPQMSMHSPIDRMFFEYLWKSPWGKDPKELSEYFSCGITARDERINQYRTVLKNGAGKKIVFWGPGSKYFPNIVSLFSIDPERDYCVDSKCESADIEYAEGIPIYPPDKLLQEERNQVFVVVCSKLYFDVIARELDEGGFVYGENFVNGMLLLKEEEGVVYVK